MSKTNTQYRIQNWRDYNQSLIQSGSITFWLSQGIAGSLYQDTHYGKRLIPNTYSDTIELVPSSKMNVGVHCWNYSS